jgi:hypothetical protein
MINGPAPLRRYVPLICWCVVLLTALFLGLKIVSLGYLPGGDVRRHVAKPFAHKPYSAIVIMRPEYTVDHSPGWEWLLAELQQNLGWNEDTLAGFSIVSLLLWIFCFPLRWLRHPETWLAAILAELVAIPELMIRWTQARPYLISEGVLMAFLFSWGRESKTSASWQKLAWTTAGFAFAIWMHGSWYLWALLIAAFFLAQRWRDVVCLTACWLAGTFVAGLLSGHLVAFLREGLFLARAVSQEHLPPWMLVGEFQPSEGEFATLVLLTLVYLWSRARNLNAPVLWLSPVFWMIALNWVLGFVADRFWADYGLPAALVWMALLFDEAWPVLVEDGSWQRLAACALIAVPLYLDGTNDLNRRYTGSLDEIFVDARDPRWQGWLPEPGGIFYADNMRFFYNTFYQNPAADWRYIVGFEPALMPPADLTVYRSIQRTRHAPEAYEPWLKKMRQEDRLETESFGQPDLPLEWRHVGNVWIGRLPRAVNSSSGH